MEKYEIAMKFESGQLKKPDAKLVGANGNVYNLMAICRKSLHKYPAAFNEMYERITSCHSYNEALAIMSEYVNII